MVRVIALKSGSPEFEPARNELISTSIKEVFKLLKNIAEKVIKYWKVFSFLLNLNLNAASKVSKKPIIVVVYRFRAITHLQDIL